MRQRTQSRKYLVTKFLPTFQIKNNPGCLLFGLCFFTPIPNQISEFAGICGAGGDPLTTSGKIVCSSYESYMTATKPKPEKPRIVFNVENGSLDLLEL